MSIKMPELPDSDLDFLEYLAAMREWDQVLVDIEDERTERDERTEP